MSKIPVVGKPAPDFQLPDEAEQMVSLSGLRGKWVVLYFYPKDDTPGCTLEAQEFSAAKADFERLNAVVLGISPDSCKKHANFIRKRELTVKLLSDPSAKMIDSYGFWQEKMMFGKTYMGVVRSTVLVDPSGVVRKVWETVKPEGHAAEVLETLVKISN